MSRVTEVYNSKVDDDDVIWNVYLGKVYLLF